MIRQLANRVLAALILGVLTAAHFAYADADDASKAQPTRTAIDQSGGRKPDPSIPISALDLSNTHPPV
jgi:hypothetical protein